MGSGVLKLWFDVEKTRPLDESRVFVIFELRSLNRLTYLEVNIIRPIKLLKSKYIV